MRFIEEKENLMLMMDDAELGRFFRDSGSLAQCVRTAMEGIVNGFNADFDGQPGNFFCSYNVGGHSLKVVGTVVDKAGNEKNVVESIDMNAIETLDDLRQKVADKVDIIKKSGTLADPA